jgi:hypothetical protein
MNDDVQILTLEQRDQWIAAHRDAGLPSQSWHYASALAASGIEPKLAVVRSGGSRMLLPFHARDWRGSTDIATILGTSGASITPGSGAPLSLWREYSVAQGWVAGYLQMSTSTQLDWHRVDGSVVDINEWFELDIGRPELFSSFSEIIRRKIRRGDHRRAALVEDRDAMADGLKTLFPIAMERVGARPNYAFANETLDRWVKSPDSMVLGASLDGRIEAVSIFLIACDNAEYHLIGSSDQGRDLAAWLIWNAIVRLKRAGIRTLHLGGGVRRGDGLHQFKQKFAGVAKPLRAVTQIYDQLRYEQLCSESQVRHEAGPWFPAYRSR